MTIEDLITLLQSYPSTTPIAIYIPTTGVGNFDTFITPEFTSEYLIERTPGNWDYPTLEEEESSLPVEVLTIS